MRRYRMGALLLCALLALAAHDARADAAGDKKRTLMASVKRIAIVPPFYGTETKSRAAALPKSTSDITGSAPDNAEKSPPSANERLAAYAEQLRKLTDHAITRLPKRVMDRTPFEVVPAEETAAALKTLDLTPESLFDNKGLMRGSKFPTPNADVVRRLARQLKADAVLLAVLDEPRRTNGHYVYNFLTGLDYNEAHVASRGGFYVMMTDGTEALHDYVSVVHPLTRIGSRQYLLVDWMEAQDLMIEDMLDEWTRYTPEKKQTPQQDQARAANARE